MTVAKTATTSRVDPRASFERWSAEERDSWTPEMKAHVNSLAQEFDFARRLREFREAFGLSQRQVGEITGEDQGDISRLERRELNPGADRMNRILGRLREYADEKVTRVPQPASQPVRITNPPLTTASIAAAYLCAIRDDEDSDFKILKLQKLLYYAQGYALALLRRPLFGERIKAWQHGPVVPQVRKEYEAHGRRQLPRPDLDLLALDPQVRAILDRVYVDYGQYAAWALRNMTHEERPWVETAQSEEIDRRVIAEFFTERLRSAARRT
jgi:uncharacterized phage-associated protein